MNVERYFKKYKDKCYSYIEALSICNILQQDAYQAVLAGGCVRDIIQNVPFNDIDIATSATPEQVCETLKNTRWKIKEVGKSFGVILLSSEENEFEIATFRTDLNCDGRHPESVAYGTMEQDAQRRDFTMNAIFFDPVNKKLFDFVGGVKDAENKKLKFVGNAEDRIKEDYFRILRYVRFLTKGYSFDSKEKMLVDSMSRDLFKYVSPERIEIELMDKLLKTDITTLLLTLIGMPVLFETLFPEVTCLVNIDQDKKYHPEGSAFLHSLAIVENLYQHKASPRLLLAGLFHDTGKAICTRTLPDGRIVSRGHEVESEKITRAWMTKMKFSNEDIEYVCGLVLDHMKLHYSGMNKSTLRKLMAKDYFNDLLLLNKCDRLSSSGDFQSYDEYIKRIEDIKDHFLPPKLVTGNDLKELGLNPSPNFGKILNFLFDAQLEGKFDSKEEGLTLIARAIYANLYCSIGDSIGIPRSYLVGQVSPFQEEVNQFMSGVYTNWV